MDSTVFIGLYCVVMDRHCVGQYCIYWTVLCSVGLHCVVLDCTVLRGTVLYWTVLYWIILDCIGVYSNRQYCVCIVL